MVIVHCEMRAVLEKKRGRVQFVALFACLMRDAFAFLPAMARE